MPIIARYSIINEKGLLRGVNYKIRHASLFTSISASNKKLGNYLHSTTQKAHYSLGWLDSSVIINILKEEQWIIPAIQDIDNIICYLSNDSYQLQLDEIKNISYLDLFNNASPKRLINMEFVTPTSFRQKGRQIILPDPRLIFLSLMSRWNAFSPINFSFPNEFYRDILWDRFAFKTEILHMSQYKIKGFVGSGTLRLWKNIPREYRRMLVCLARYAEISGVGYKTTMGFGVVRGNK